MTDSNEEQTFEIDNQKLHPIAGLMLSNLLNLNKIEQAFVLSMLVYCVGGTTYPSLISLIQEFVPQIEHQAKDTP